MKMTLIDRDDLIKTLSKCKGIFTPEFLIDIVNGADVIDPVIHAHWIHDYDEYFEDDIYTCSHCYEPYIMIDGSPAENLYNYCPNCGTKMDEVINDG